MSKVDYDVIVCGAGMVGVAAAYSLASMHHQKVLLIDSGAPLSMTSDKSTECYRNWWGGPDNAMLTLMNRSISLMEQHAFESKNRFLLNPHGYLFATAMEAEVDKFRQQAKEAEELGAGDLREINRLSEYRRNMGSSFVASQDGADLIINKALVNELFPYLNPDTVAVLHARRCGSLSAQQLGMYLLEKARENGCEFKTALLSGVETKAGMVNAVNMEIDGAQKSFTTKTVVFSTGPYLKSSLELINVELPIVVEKHVKITIPDPLGIIPRDAPLIIWNDPIKLPWSDEEKRHLEISSETDWLLKNFVPGVHGRPIGAGDQVLMYWTYDCHADLYPEFPIDWDPYLPEITLRGMSVMVPGLKEYFDPMPRPYVDGGYYTKTEENRPLIGPLEVPGAFVCSAFSGFGIMASCGAGELLAQHVMGAVLPNYAKAFLPSRYNDPVYRESIKDWVVDGQL